MTVPIRIHRSFAQPDCRRAVLIALCALAGLLPPAALGKPTVILLSWDGFRHDYPDRDGLPAVTRMAQHGARAGRLETVRPSDTFPSHVSLATGTYPDRHGIVGNQFIDREAGRYRMSSDTRWLQAEPLWIAAERQGVPAATYFWVGSEQDWRGQGTRYRIAPFDGSRSESAKVTQILAWLALPEAERPQLIMCYWRGADRVGHRYGPASGRVDAQLREQDAALGELLAGLDALDRWDDTTLMIVSDHGMTPVGDFLPVAAALRDAGIKARVVGYTLAHVFLEDPNRRSEAQTVLEAVHEAVTVHDGRALPAAWRLAHPTRTGDLVVTVPPPYVLSEPAGIEGFMTRLLRFFGWDYGGHGFDPALPDMGAAFLALGRGVAPGHRLDRLHVTDVAPTVARLLGIDPPLSAEGVAIDLMPEAQAVPAPTRR